MIEFNAADGLEAADVLVVPVLADRQWGPGAEEAVAVLGDITAHLDRADFSGKPGQLLELAAPPDAPWSSVLLVGVGEDPDAEAVRKAAGSAARRVARATSVVTTLHQLAGGRAFAEGFLLGQYRFDKYRSEAKPSLTEIVKLAAASNGDLEAAATGATIAAAVALARDLVNEPPVAKSPIAMAEQAVAEGEAAGVRVVVHDENAIAEMGLGGLGAVNSGALQPGRMVEMWYEPQGADKFLALVGKGIVFDSGGLSLKPANMMEDMKTDMSGGAAVIAAIKAIAQMGLRVKVAGFVPITENLPGGNAMRPGDVITARNGKTIEVLNTDAEGRLVLADGLSLAAEAEPDLIVDVATLTGACKVALGEEIAGYFANDDAAASAVAAAGDRSGERIWQLPLPADYRKKIDSDVADMKNTGPRWGGAITAAHLLQEFVGKTPWAHVDIAGPARATADDGYVTKGGTGYGVRLLVALAEEMAD
ncbi:MAG: leucyl aminopeptidase [Acidimicrobiia bacterium]|nr:leucyl aminopeptidase [Acidimicrobiia bacterium]